MQFLEIIRAVQEKKNPDSRQPNESALNEFYPGYQIINISYF